MLNFAAIVQVRRNATRLPDKMFQKIGKLPLIEHAVCRLKAAKTLDDVIVATTANPLDDKVEDWCATNNISCYRGSEEDVLQRYVEAAQAFKATNIVRACGDNPFTDTELIDILVKSHQTGAFDLTNTRDNIIVGSAVEVITRSSLEKVERNAQKTAYREHVTPYFYNHPKEFSLHFIEAPTYLSQKAYRITVDTEDDLELCRNVYNNLSRAAGSENCLISTRQVVEYLQKNPDIAAMNQSIRQKDWREELEAEA